MAAAAAVESVPVGSVWIVEATAGERVTFTPPGNSGTVTVLADGNGAHVVLDREGVWAYGEQIIRAKD